MVSVEQPIPTTKRLTVDRRHSLAGRTDLNWFFANKKWIRTTTNTLVEAAYAVRPTTMGSSGLRILVLAPKRSYKRAHDRNQLKRWLREAVAQQDAFMELERRAKQNDVEVLLMLRCQKHLTLLNWTNIREGVGLAAEACAKQLRTLLGSSERLYRSEPRESA